MKDHYIEPEYNAVAEARRYVENAKETLRLNGKYNPEFDSYEDRKYVRAAGHYLWNAVLIILEAKYHLKKNKRSRVDVDDYKMCLTKDDKKLLTYTNNAYDIMHLNMGYDGVLNKRVCDEGFRLADDIINRCETMIN